MQSFRAVRRARVDFCLRISFYIVLFCLSTCRKRACRKGAAGFLSALARKRSIYAPSIACGSGFFIWTYE
jgi:hypothetical protein